MINIHLFGELENYQMRLFKWIHMARSKVQRSFEQSRINELVKC